MPTNCPLCHQIGGGLIYENEFIRAINANDPDYPAFTRIILQAHVREMTDLTVANRHRLMNYVYAVEEVQKQLLQPTKINLAQFGTLVPHLHWHIIPRFNWDLHYPSAYWSDKNSPHENYAHHLAEHSKKIQGYHHALAKRLAKI